MRIIILPLIVFCLNCSSLFANNITSADVENMMDELTNQAGLSLINKISNGEFTSALTHIEKLNSKVMKDISYENKLVLELNHFKFTKKKLSDKVDSLVKENPTNPLSYLIRGYYLSAKARNARGGESINRTKKEQMDNMINIQKLAIHDYEKVLQYTKGHYLAHMQLGNIHVTRGNTQLSQYHFGKAFKLQPASYWLWAKKLRAATPRWGGSYKLMESMLYEMKKYIKYNSNLKILKNSILLDLAELAEYKNDFDEAKRIYTSALKYGYDHRILIGLGYVNMQQGNFKDGCPKIKDALKQRPYESRYIVNFLMCKNRGFL